MRSGDVAGADDPSRQRRLAWAVLKKCAYAVDVLVWRSVRWADATRIARLDSDSDDQLIVGSGAVAELPVFQERDVMGRQIGDAAEHGFSPTDSSVEQASSDPARPDSHSAAASLFVDRLLASEPSPKWSRTDRPGFANQLEGILASTAESRRLRVQARLAGKLFDGLSWNAVHGYLQAHWPAIAFGLGLTAASIVVTDGLAAAMLSLVCTILGVDAAATGVEVGGHYGQRWVQLAGQARGDEAQLDQACEQFLLMLLSIGGAALSIAGARASARSLPGEVVVGEPINDRGVHQSANHVDVRTTNDGATAHESHLLTSTSNTETPDATAAEPATSATAPEAREAAGRPLRGAGAVDRSAALKRARSDGAVRPYGKQASTPEAPSGRRGDPLVPDEASMLRARARLDELQGVELDAAHSAAVQERQQAVGGMLDNLHWDQWAPGSESDPGLQRSRTSVGLFSGTKKSLERLPVSADPLRAAVIEKVAHRLADRDAYQAYVSILVDDGERLAVLDSGLSSSAAYRKLLMLRARARGQAVDVVTHRPDDMVEGHGLDFFQALVRAQGALIDKAFRGTAHGAYPHMLQMDYLRGGLTNEEYAGLMNLLVSPESAEVWRRLFDGFDKNLNGPLGFADLPVPLETPTKPVTKKSKR